MIYKYFPSFYVLCFHFLDSVLWCSKVLILFKLNLCIFSFIVYVFVLFNNNSLSNSRLYRFYLMFSSKRLIILALAFRHFICFELIFVYDVRYGSTFFLLHVDVQLSQHHLLKRLFFPHCTILAPIQKSVEHRVYGFLSDSQFCFIDLHVCPYASNRLFWLL